MSLRFYDAFVAQRTPATIVRTAVGGVATFAGSGVVVEFRSDEGALTEFAIRDSASGVAVTVSRPDLPALRTVEPELARIADALRADTGLQ